MRVKLDLDAVSQQNVPQRFMMALPPALTLVSDLVHHLHRRLSLPACSLTLAVDSFALLPALRIEDVLRDGDMVQVWPAVVASPMKRRKVTKVKEYSMLALADASPGYLKHVEARPPLYAKRDLAPCLALPPPEERVAQKGHDSKAQAEAWRQDCSAHHQKQRHPRLGTSGQAISRSSDRKQAPAFLALPPLQEHTSASTNISKSSAGICGIVKECSQHNAHDSNCTPSDDLRSSKQTHEGAQDKNPTAGESMLQLPDAHEEHIWKAIARDPLPGEIIRFRSARLADALSDFQVALCSDVLDTEDGKVCVLQQAKGVGDEQVPVSQLLQISIKRLKPPPQKKIIKAMAAMAESQAEVAPSLLTNHVSCVADTAQATAIVDMIQEEVPSNREVYQACGSTGVDLAIAAEVAPIAMTDKESTRARNSDEEEDQERNNNYPEAIKKDHIQENVPVGPEFEDFAQDRLQKLSDAVKRQVDFYFGDANYRKDNFLRSTAGYDGWTDLTLVAKFNRMRELTRDYSLIVECLQTSDIVEVSDCGFYVRRKFPLS